MSRRLLFASLLLCLVAAVLLTAAGAPHLSRPTALSVGSMSDSKYVRSGFYDRENVEGSPYRWASDRGVFVFPNRGLLPLTLSFALDAPRPDGQAQPRVAVVVNGEAATEFEAAAGVRDYTVQYVPHGWFPADLGVELLSETYLPPGDPRDLGVLVSSVSLSPDAALSAWRFLALVLFSLLPGILLVPFVFLVLAQGGFRPWVAATVALVSLLVEAWGVSADRLGMGVLVPLLSVLVVVSLCIAAANNLGLRARIVEFAEARCGAGGRALGAFAGRTFSPAFVGMQRRRLLGWVAAHRWDLLIALALFVLALLVRLPYYLEMPHITDEFREVQIATEVANGTYYPLFFSTTDYLGIVHSYLLGLVIFVFGMSLYVPRLYVVFMGALTVVLTYWFVREMEGRTQRVAALIAAGLMLCSPMHILIGSHVAWMNSTTPVFCLLMLIAFYRGVAKDRGWCLAVSGLLAGIALQTHPLVALLFPGMVVRYVQEQCRRRRSIRQWLSRPAPYVAIVLFLLAYGNIIWYNSHGRLYILAAAQRRDAMQQSPWHIATYLHTVRDMLQNLLSSVSGNFDFRLSVEAVVKPGLVFYGMWLLAGVVYSGAKKRWFLLLLLVPSLLLLPFVNQNWAIPGKSRYLFHLLPVCYFAMALPVADVWERLGRAGARTVWVRRALVAVCVIAVAYPLWPLWGFYRTYGDSEWSNRGILRATELLRGYREQSVPIYLDANIRKTDLPIVGSNLLKALEYELYLDGTESRVVWFDREKKPPRTFNHEVEYVAPAEIEAPSVWALTPGTRNWLIQQPDIVLDAIEPFNQSEPRFGLYELTRP